MEKMAKWFCVISCALLLLFIMSYILKSKLGIDILPHRHLLIFKDK